jgi:PIN domain nuclease of toxin-antitoxin system
LQNEKRKQIVADTVVNASAVLALLNDEPGAKRVAEVLPGAFISTVNMTEVITRLVDWGLGYDEIHETIDALGLEQHAFTPSLAYDAALLRSSTRAQGLSLGDRACLALGIALGARVLTADRPWLTLNLGLDIEYIRPAVTD